MEHIIRYQIQLIILFGFHGNQLPLVEQGSHAWLMDAGTWSNTEVRYIRSRSWWLGGGGADHSAVAGEL